MAKDHNLCAHAHFLRQFAANEPFYHKICISTKLRDFCIFMFVKVSKYSTKRIFWLAVASLSLYLISSGCHAEGRDLLAHTADDLDATIKNSGKHYLYLGEFVMCMLTGIMKRSILAFMGIFVMSILFNLGIKITGI